MRVRSYHNSENRVSRNLTRAENYLSLIGFIIVILGGIGVWSVTRVFIHQKLKSIAILKCVGATTSQLLAVYLLQVLTLGLAGSLLGVAIAAAAIGTVPADVVAGYGEIAYGLTPSATAQGVGIGVLVTLLFSLVPLLEVRHVRPLLLLRDEAGGRAQVDWLRWAAIVSVTGALVMVTSWQAGSLRVGVYVSAGFAGVGVALHLAATALVHAVAPLSRLPWFPLRHAVMSLGRPGNQTRTILLAVGLGSFFLIGIRALQANLLQEFSLEVREDAPDMFLIDIQQDQAAGVAAFLEAHAVGEAPRLIPIVRARVIGVEGRRVNLDGVEDVRGRGSLARQYVVTYRDELEENERIIDSRLWSDDPASMTEVSIEESIRERFDIDIGDTMRFDVLGRTVEARVASVRAVEWNDTRRGGFMFVFRPDALADAPHSFIATLQGPVAVDERARMQRDLVSRYPNVSAIDIRDVMAAAKDILDKVTTAISVVGAISVFTGALILIGSVAMTKFQRLYEAAIFKTLGASTKTIAAMLLLEYGGLGALAGAVGSIGSLALTWAISQYLLEISWRPAPLENLGGVLVTAIAVGAVGVLSSLDVLKRKPLLTLRAE